MTPQEQALRYALLKVLVGELAAAKKAADCEVRDTWRPSDRLTATLPNRKDIGTVTLARGKATASVTDEAAYIEWVRKVHPMEVETVHIMRVKPDYTQRLLAAARQLGVALDGATAEVVPGVDVRAGDPYPMVKLADDAREAVAKAWQAGELADLVSGLLAIEGGEES